MQACALCSKCVKGARAPAFSLPAHQQTAPFDGCAVCTGRGDMDCSILVKAAAADFTIQYSLFIVAFLLKTDNWQDQLLFL